MVSTPLKFSQKHFLVALGKSAYYLVKLKRGVYIHGKTFVVLLKPWKTRKFSSSNLFLSMAINLFLAISCYKILYYKKLTREHGIHDYLPFGCLLSVTGLKPGQYHWPKWPTDPDSNLGQTWIWPGCDLV